MLIPILLPFFNRSEHKKEMNKIEGRKLLAQAHKQSQSMCECGHSWIEHNNNATLTSEGFVTNTKECHFCKCRSFKGE